MFKKTKLYTLYNLIRKISDKERPRLIIIERTQSLFSHPQHLSFSEYMENEGLFTGLRPSRGDILKAFSAIEFIINEIIIAYVNPDERRKVEFEDILNRIELTQKIRLLVKWDLITEILSDKIILIKEVRDGFAHKWIDEEIKYKGKQLNMRESFYAFKHDLVEIWSGLTEIYNVKYPDIDELIARYKELVNEERVAI